MSYLNDPEREILFSTQAGQKTLQVLSDTLAKQTGEVRVAKADELSRTSREIMRAGLSHDHPNASDQELDDLVFDQMMRIHQLPARIEHEVREHRRRYLASRNP